MGEMRNACNIHLGKPERKPLGRPRRRWNSFIKLVLDKYAVMI